MSHFTVDILTPSKVVEIDFQADKLKIPTFRGEIEILPEHTHIIEKIDTGVIEIFTGNSSTKYMVTTGVAKILGNKVTLLANVCESQSEIDKERAEIALGKAQARLKEAGSFEEDLVIKFQRKLTRAKIRLLLSQ